jgi:ribosomal protein S12 methylthiotransferase
VDANGISLLLQRHGYLSVAEPAEADVLIVNTCGFISLARVESLEALERLAVESRPDQRVVAAGCWAQREPDKLLDYVPELDAVIGTRSWYGLPELLRMLVSGKERLILTEDRRIIPPEELGAPGYATCGPSAFLKVADGCSRQCAFCAIPLIKGPTVSRSLEAILDDARALQQQGMLEVNLIAQDSTFYGYDLGMKEGLAQLLERLVAEVPDIPWLRVLYMFPGYVTPRLIRVMADSSQILPYVDIPLQHAHPDVLRRMRRPNNVDEVRRTIDALRIAMPDVCLRTTFVVGFPGETDREFLTLLSFIEETAFDRVGVFTYSHETGTPAAALADDVPEDVKEARRDALMMAQQPISRAKNEDLVGNVLTVLTEDVNEGVVIGRGYRDAPGIDGLVMIEGDEVPLGQFVRVEITEARTYDLQGRLISD